MLLQSPHLGMISDDNSDDNRNSRAVRAVLVQEASRVVRAILQHGVDTGQLPASLDFERAVARLLGPLLCWRLPPGRPVARPVVADAVDALLVAPSPGRLAGRAARTAAERRGTVPARRTERSGPMLRAAGDARPVGEY